MLTLHEENSNNYKGTGFYLFNLESFYLKWIEGKEFFEESLDFLTLIDSMTLEGSDIAIVVHDDRVYQYDSWKKKEPVLIAYDFREGNHVDPFRIASLSKKNWESIPVIDGSWFNKQNYLFSMDTRSAQVDIVSFDINIPMKSGLITRVNSPNEIYVFYDYINGGDRLSSYETKIFDTMMGLDKSYSAKKKRFFNKNK